MVLRPFSCLFVSEEHFVILRPELLSLLELHTRLEARLGLMRLILPPVLGLFILRELGKLHAVNTYSDCAKLLCHVHNHVLAATSFDIGLGQSWLGFVLCS